MKSIPQIIKELKSGVVKISFYQGEKRVNSGSGFLCRERLISNNHVFFDPNNNPLEGTMVGIRLGNMAVIEDDLIKMSYENFMEKLESSSSSENYDYSIFKINEIDYNKCFQFELGDHDDTEEGEQVLIMGYPFGLNNLTSHLGYASSIFNKGGINIIQLDASVNNGNSGGPLINIKTHKVVGIITRKQTGLAEQFDELIKSFDANIDLLLRLKGSLRWGGLDIMDIFSASQRQMKSIAWNIKRSSNVGIGFAFSCNKLKEEKFYVSKS